MDPIATHLLVHIGLGTLVRSLVVGLALRRCIGRWSPWPEVLTASLSPVMLRALLGEGAYLLLGYRPVGMQVMSAAAAVALQVVTIRIATDHERARVSLRMILLIALLAQLSAHTISGPLARWLLGSQ